MTTNWSTQTEHLQIPQSVSRSHWRDRHRRIHTARRLGQICCARTRQHGYSRPISRPDQGCGLSAPVGSDQDEWYSTSNVKNQTFSWLPKILLKYQSEEIQRLRVQYIKMASLHWTATCQHHRTPNILNMFLNFWRGKIRLTALTCSITMEQPWTQLHQDQIRDKQMCPRQPSNKYPTAEQSPR